MVEGHGVHRTASAARKKLKGKRFKASSPNGRFTEGAKAVDGKNLTRVEAIGKNLFLFFSGSEGEELVVVHIHFGMAGRCRIAALPGPAATNTTRLELRNDEHDLVVHVSAMTVQFAGIELYEKKYRALGPDPLRDDADPERLWRSLRKSKKSVGEVLMAQELIAGVGNIYRAEILFKARLHPEQPASTLSRPAFLCMWRHSVELLQRGFLTGSILTVDEKDAERLGPPWTRRYIYNQSHCGECGNRARSWQDKNNRTIYACPFCQPLQEMSRGEEQEQEFADKSRTNGTSRGKAKSKSARRGGRCSSTASEQPEADFDGGGYEQMEVITPTKILPADRIAAMKKSRPVEVFVSHCAPDHDRHQRKTQSLASQIDGNGAGNGDDIAGSEAETLPTAKMTVKQLKAELKVQQARLGRKIKTGGRRAELISRVESNRGALTEGSLCPSGSTSTGTGKQTGKKHSTESDSPEAAGSGKAASGATTRVRALAMYESEQVLPVAGGLPTKMTSAAGAMREKHRAGENRAVEHIALEDEESMQLLRQITDGGSGRGSGRGKGRGSGSKGGKGNAKGRAKAKTPQRPKRNAQSAGGSSAGGKKKRKAPMVDLTGDFDNGKKDVRVFFKRTRNSVS